MDLHPTTTPPGVSATDLGAPPEERLPRLVARRLYGDLRRQGFSADQLLALAAELIEAATSELDPGAR